MGADRFRWELVSDGDTATKALSADERLELERLRALRRECERLLREMRNAMDDPYWPRELDEIISRSER